MEVKHLDSQSFNEALKTDKLVLVDFYAAWCGPCRMMAPILERVNQEVNNFVDIYKVDVDECEDIAKNYGIMSIPTLVLIKNGQEIKRNVGLLNQENLLELLNNNK